MSLVDATTGVVVTAVVDLVAATTGVDLAAATTGVAVVVFLVETLFLAGVAGIVAEAVSLDHQQVVIVPLFQEETSLIMW